MTDELEALRARYEIASDAYHEIATRNLQEAVTGSHPTAEALQREDAARDLLGEARREYLLALRSPLRD